MQGARTLLSILGQPWLINQSYVENNLPLILNMLEGKLQLPSEDPDPIDSTLTLNSRQEAAYVNLHRNSHHFYENLEKPVVGVIDIDHPITRHDNCGDYGSMTLSNMVREADASEKIIGIVLSIDSPGGMVSGTQELAEAVRNTSTPIVALVRDGYAASAAYWIASQADQVFVTNQTSQVGSIGAYLTFMDVRGYFEKEGIKIHEIYSRLSTEKNLAFRLARDEEDYAQLQDELDEIVSAFTSQVRAARKIPESVKEPFKGAMYSAAVARPSFVGYYVLLLV